MPQEAIVKGITGYVVARATVAHGRIADIVFVSGPEVFYDPIRKSMGQYVCVNRSEVVSTSQSFNFQLE
jgi:hypothetical protein